MTTVVSECEKMELVDTITLKRLIVYHTAHNSRQAELGVQVDWGGWEGMGGRVKECQYKKE